MTLGKRIKALRIAKGMSQDELGAKVGLQKAAISKYENGLITDMKRSLIAKFAEVLETTPNYIMGYGDKEKLAPITEGEHDALDLQIIDKFSQLSTERQKLILAQIDAWLSID